MSESVDIDHIAKLARLKISEANKAKVKKDIEKTLDMFDQIMSLDNLEQLSRGFRRAAETCELREDQTDNTVSPKEMAQFAPAFDEDEASFIVPLTVKKKADEVNGDEQ